MDDNRDIFREDFFADDWETIQTVLSDVKTKIVYKDKDDVFQLASNFDRFVFVQLFAICLVGIIAPIAEAFTTNNIWNYILIAVDAAFLLVVNKISISKWIYSLFLIGFLLDQQDGLLFWGGVNLAILNTLHSFWVIHLEKSLKKNLISSEDLFIDAWLNNIECIETPGRIYVHNYSSEVHKKELEQRQARVQQEKEQLEYYNQEFKKRFAQYHNPVTKEPICTAQDYLEAIAAQETNTTFKYNKKLTVEELNILFCNRFSESGREINTIADYLWYFDKQQESLQTTASPDRQSKQQVEADDNSATKSKEEYLEELNALIGMDTLKKDVKELISLVQMQKYRESNGLKSLPVSLHLVFTGNPGTGKTSVARILANIYREIGILSKGQLIEVDRADLVAGYVGQTAIKTKEKIQEAMGGILFIDEAYTLNKEGNDFGQEAIDTLLKAMEDERDKFIVIAAGYPDLMETFINSNPGLRSRFNKTIYFPDYNSDELFEIFEKFCDDYDYYLSEEAANKIQEIIEEMENNKGNNFANARDVRNLFEKVISNQASRAMGNINLSGRDMMTIASEDVFL